MDQISLTQDLAALAQVILIDITLAGDNAIVVGMAVAGLPAHQKRPAILARHHRRHGDPHCAGRHRAGSCWRSSA